MSILLVTVSDSLRTVLYMNPLSYFIMDESSRELGLSTFSSTQMDTHRKAGFEFVERPCPVTTLANVCEHVSRERLTSSPLTWKDTSARLSNAGTGNAGRPRVIVIEAAEPYKNVPVHDNWEALLLAEDYLFATFVGINRYYQDRQLLPDLSAPVKSWTVTSRTSIYGRSES